MTTFIRTLSGWSYFSPDGNTSGWDVEITEKCEFCNVELPEEMIEQSEATGNYKLCPDCAEEYKNTPDEK